MTHTEAQDQHTRAMPLGDDAAPTQALMRRSAVALAGGVVGGAFGLLLSVIVGRSFGTEGAGIFFSVVAVVMVMSNTLELGADTGSVWMLARLRASGRAHLQRRAVAVALFPVLIVSGLAAILLFLNADPLAQILGGGEQTAQGLRFGAIAVFGGTVSTVAVSITRGFGLLWPMVGLQNIALPVLRVIGVSFAALAGMSVVSGIALWAGSWFLIGAIAITLCVLLVRNLPDQWRAGSQDRSPKPGVAAEFWRFSAPRALAAVVEIALVWLDVLIVAALVGPVEAGIYAVASRFVTSGMLGLDALRVSLSPRFSALFARGDVSGASDLLAQAAPLSVAFGWPIFIVAASQSSELLAIFGDGFEAGAPVLILLSLTMLALAPFGPVQSVLLMSGRSGWQLANKVCALVVQVSVDLLLIPSIGIVGAAIGWGAGMIVDQVLSIVVLSRNGVRLHPRGALSTIALISVAGLVVIGGVQILELSGLSALLCSAAGMGLVALALLVSPRSPASLRRALKEG